MSNQIKLCPNCGVHNAPNALRCTCGVLLTGVDPTTPCLFQLPTELTQRYRLLKTLPVQQVDAELMQIQALEGGPLLLLKLYRHGRLAAEDMWQRVENIPLQYREAILASGLASGRAYEIKEWCEHGSLRQLCFASVPFDSLVSELHQALQHAHAEGLVHRELKPENVLIRSLSPLNLILSDFQVAAIMDATQRLTRVATALWYAAPESLSGVIDYKVDYWAMGMMLLEYITGKHPFEGLNQAQMLHQLSASSIKIELADKRVVQLLQGLLLRNPSLRWGNQEIQRWLQLDQSLTISNEPLAERRARYPYNLVNHDCYTITQLAVAIVEHWQEALEDLKNGLLLDWLRDELHQTDVTTHIADKSKSDAVRLVMLLHYLAPEQVAIWQGITLDDKHIRTQVECAISGRADAICWLDSFYNSELPTYFASQNQHTLQKVCHAWLNQLKQFNCTALQITELYTQHAPEIAPRLPYWPPPPPHAELLIEHFNLLQAQHLQQCGEQRWQKLIETYHWLQPIFDQLPTTTRWQIVPALQMCLQQTNYCTDKPQQNRQQMILSLRDEVVNQVGLIQELCSATLQREDLISLNGILSQLQAINSLLQTISKHEGPDVYQKVFGSAEMYTLTLRLGVALRALWAIRAQANWLPQASTVILIVVGSIPALAILYFLTGTIFSVLITLGLASIFSLELINMLWLEYKHSRKVRKIASQLQQNLFQHSAS